MKYYVYLIVMETCDSILYVGYSNNPKGRFRQHTEWEPHKDHGHGKFYGRTDIRMEIIDEFDTKKQALQFEHELQKNLFGESDREVRNKTHRETLKNNSSILESMRKSVGKALKEAHKNSIPLQNHMNKIVKCTNCQKEGKQFIMGRWHFDNCKYKTSHISTLQK